MKLQNSTVLVTGATGNMGPYVVDRLVDEVIHLLSNKGVTGQIVQMISGQSGLED